MSEDRRSEEASEILIALLTPQGDFLPAVPTLPVQTVEMTPDIKEYHTLHSLPPVYETGAHRVILQVIIRNKFLNTGCNPSEGEIISVRLKDEEVVLIEREFHLHRWAYIHHAESLILPDVAKYAQAKTNKDVTSAEVAIAIVYLSSYTTPVNFVPLI